MEDRFTISLAPLQGYTDWNFRKTYAKYIGGIDLFYTPFLVLQNSGEIKSAHRKEIEPFDEKSEKLIPQFLGNSVKEIQFFEQYFSDLGYQQMNWNLGCPYPMVTKRGKGSGMLTDPNNIRKVLEEGYSEKIKLSVKTRLGLEKEDDIFPVLDVLNDFPIEELILHPRIGKQLYKGKTNWEQFGKCLSHYKNGITYNGDINNYDDYLRLKEQFPTLSRLMIGRGILMDYWLPYRIKKIALPEEEERKQILKEFHDLYYQSYAEYLSGENQLLQKMKPFWEYFSFHFQNSRKVYKQVKKSVNLKKYDSAVAFAFQQRLEK